MKLVWVYHHDEAQWRANGPDGLYTIARAVGCPGAWLLTCPGPTVTEWSTLSAAKEIAEDTCAAHPKGRTVTAEDQRRGLCDFDRAMMLGFDTIPAREWGRMCLRYGVGRREWGYLQNLQKPRYQGMWLLVILGPGTMIPIRMARWYERVWWRLFGRR